VFFPTPVFFPNPIPTPLVLGAPALNTLGAINGTTSFASACSAVPACLAFVQSNPVASFICIDDRYVGRSNGKRAVAAVNTNPSFYAFKGKLAISRDTTVSTSALTPPSFIRVNLGASNRVDTDTLFCSGGCVSYVSGFDLGTAGVAYTMSGYLASQPYQTVSDALAGASDLTNLRDLLAAVSMLDVFADTTAALTLFAPTNSAFETLNGQLRDCLTDGDHNDALANILGFHVVNGKAYPLSRLRSMSLGGVQTQSGGISVEPQNNGDVVLSGTSTVRGTDGDNFYINGIIHRVNYVMVPVNYDAAWIADNCVVSGAEGLKVNVMTIFFALCFIIQMLC